MKTQVYIYIYIDLYTSTCDFSLFQRVQVRCFTLFTKRSNSFSCQTKSLRQNLLTLGKPSSHNLNQKEI